MAGRPKRRARLARAQLEAGSTDQSDQVVVLTPDAIESIEQGEEAPPGGNGMRASFAELSKDELRRVQEKGLETRRRKRELAKLGEMQAWYEANKELAGVVFGAKVQVFEGLLRKGLDEDGTVDPSRLEKHELTELTKLIESYENRMFGKAAQKIEHTGQVEVQHRVAQILEGLEGE